MKLNTYKIFSTKTPPRGEGDDAGDTTFSQTDLDTAVAAAVARANDEATRKFDATKSTLLSDLRKAKDVAKSFDGLDADTVKNMMKAFENDQDLKDMADGKHDEVIKRRIEKEKAQFTSDINAATEKATTLETQNNELVNKVSKLMIDNNVVSEFVKEKGNDTAIPDVILRANQVFKVEGDDLIPRDSQGEIIAGKNGPMTINEWVGSLKETAPHLFPGSQGTGTPGGDSGSGGSDISSQKKKAAAEGNMKEYQRLRNKERGLDK